MQDFLKWTLETIRKDESMMSWMEERRFEWVPIVQSALQKLVDGKTFLFYTDKERGWFERYFLNSINSPTQERPLLPFVSLRSIFPNIDDIKNKEDIAILNDMLELSFSGGYLFFYVGKSQDLRAQIAKSSDESFLWMFDEHLQNSFHLSSSDDLLDIRLIQLYRLLNKSINAVLFAQIEI